MSETTKSLHQRGHEGLRTTKQPVFLTERHLFSSGSVTQIENGNRFTNPLQDYHQTQPGSMSGLGALAGQQAPDVGVERPKTPQVRSNPYCQSPGYFGRRDRPPPAVVIQKFDGDPMNYWLFVRQFEAYKLGKVEEQKLFPLLHQSCEPSVQLKISHLSNQSPSSSFQRAWDILYDEFGHSHEIA